ncbi:FAD-dependent oxidoreductase [Thermodesulforhabdus norvegica]|uniref:Heterodisulfide reductase subunit A n=1 Tax=Thermodesulforhabdus norvegica TaxID=39841 RepID=A0A1I4THA4_9BACT|nr:FAD-dependent oxidoreductase [Thermodesulforhabdus norvegica]SFM76035.1 heterodisulfide reductase subunit A [Thermodesulforhabdus norvegica]
MGGSGELKNVVVIGGGVAGLNAALDLADQGFNVYVLEKGDSLGGLIPKLHRLYPICSCCKVTNRAIACQQHPNIKVMTCATVEDISGSAPSFKVSVKTLQGSQQIEAGAIILAPGLEPFDPSVYDTYAYSAFPNVITSVEFEWMQKPIGPNKGVVTRPSDGQVPKKVAWLQCVGSRDVNKCDAPYCSSVCCMYALKEAVHFKDAVPEADTAIFFMDMRTHGKGYEQYLNNAKEKGVRFVRTRIHSIERGPGSEDLVLEYVDENGDKKEEVFDLVVLSVGLRPSPGVKEVAEKLGVKLTEYGYIETAELDPCATGVPGVFACGAATGPRDVFQSVTEAQAAAARVAAYLGGSGDGASGVSLRDVSGEEPRVGILFSVCPGRPAGFDALVDDLMKFGKELQGVASVERIDLVDSQAFAKVAEWLKASGVNRLIYASCNPIMHREMIEWAMKQAGLNPTLYDYVDMRIVGTDENHRTRLRDQIRAAVLHARLTEPLPVKAVPVEQSALVVGGGIAGMTAALALADQGIQVTLVEKKDRLGGHAHKVHGTWQGTDIQSYVADLTKRVQNNPRINVLLNANVDSARGFGGQFETTIVQNGNRLAVKHGAVIIATGAHSLRPREYCYGDHPEIYRWSDLAKKLIDDPDAFKSARCGVFIQCVGSREPERPYCSRLCCTFAVRTACDLKEKNPDLDLYVLYRDIRTFGEREKIYKEAREKGVLFVRFDVERKPVVKVEDGRIKVRVFDPILGRELLIEPDFISLQSAIYAEPIDRLAAMYKVSLNDEGFLRESPAKMRPVDAEMEGVFAAGLVLGPKGVEESVVEAWAAAGRALRFLRQGVVMTGGVVAEVNPDRCAVCLTCVRTCPFGIPYIESVQEAAYIDPSLCVGCGMCVSECPGKAIMYRKLSDDQIVEMTRALVQEA